MKHKIMTNLRTNGKIRDKNMEVLFNKPYNSYLKEKTYSKVDKWIKTLNELVEWSKH